MKIIECLICGRGKKVNNCDFIEFFDICDNCGKRLAKEASKL
jgi:uncharacterized protein (DUF983 family)